MILYSTHLVHALIAITTTIPPFDARGWSPTIQSMAHVLKGWYPLCVGMRYGGGHQTARYFCTDRCVATYYTHYKRIPYHQYWDLNTSNTCSPEANVNTVTVANTISLQSLNSGIYTQSPLCLIHSFPPSHCRNFAARFTLFWAGSSAGNVPEMTKASSSASNVTSRWAW